MKSIAFFNNKGGVGKTTLVFHLASMFAELGVRTLAVDLDPQSNLSAMSIEDLYLLEIVESSGERCLTMFDAVKPIMDAVGDFRPLPPYSIDDRFGLLIGDLALSRYEDYLAEAWPAILAQRRDALLRTTAFARIIAAAGGAWEADVALIDVGPNLGALNRAALIAADFIVVPLAPDLFSIQALRDLGPTLVQWRRDWRDRRERFESPPFPLPAGRMDPIGYVVMQHAMRLDRPVLAYGPWMDQIPETYARSVLTKEKESSLQVRDDPSCLALLRNYRSLMPLAMEAHKPMFLLRSGDGAIGAQQEAVRACYVDFRDLAKSIAGKIDLKIPLMEAYARRSDVAR